MWNKDAIAVTYQHLYYLSLLLSRIPRFQVTYEIEAENSKHIGSFGLLGFVASISSKRFIVIKVLLTQ